MTKINEAPEFKKLFDEMMLKEWANTTIEFQKLLISEIEFCFIDYWYNSTSNRPKRRVLETIESEIKRHESIKSQIDSLKPFPEDRLLFMQVELESCHFFIRFLERQKEKLSPTTEPAQSKEGKKKTVSHNGKEIYLPQRESTKIKWVTQSKMYFELIASGKNDQRAKTEVFKKQTDKHINRILDYYEYWKEKSPK